MPRSKDKYLICTYLENSNTKNFQGPMVRRVLDKCSFANEDVERCLDRKNYLEQTAGKKSVRAYLMTEI
jgi:hypothetical protein